MRAFGGIRKSDLRFYASNESYNCSLLQRFFVIFCASPNAATMVSFLFVLLLLFMSLSTNYAMCRDAHIYALRPIQKPNNHSSPLWEPSRRTYLRPALLVVVFFVITVDGIGIDVATITSLCSPCDARKVAEAERKNESRWICSILMTILLWLWIVILRHVVILLLFSLFVLFALVCRLWYRNYLLHIRISQNRRMSFIVSGFHLNLESAIDDVSFEFIDANTSYTTHTPVRQRRSWEEGERVREKTFSRVQRFEFYWYDASSPSPFFASKLANGKEFFMRDDITIKLVNIFPWLSPFRRENEEGDTWKSTSATTTTSDRKMSILFGFSFLRLCESLKSNNLFWWNGVRVMSETISVWRQTDNRSASDSWFVGSWH